MTPRGDGTRALALGLAFVAALTVWRVAGLAVSRLDLFTDEAQYWFWSTELAFGYFSKPPLIAWIIRAATTLGGSAESFWVRLPAPLIHACTAGAIAWVGTLAYGPRRGALAGVAFATLPAVSVGAMVISTDTPMLLCFALALGLLMRLASRPSMWLAAMLGLAVGVGALAKYAMLYFVPCALLAALLVPRMRVPWRHAALATGVGAGVLAPNLLWNAAEGFVTLTHTVHNANWREQWLNPLELLEFLAAQAAVFGPVTLGALVVAWLGARRGDWADRTLTLFSLPILAIVSFQALRSEANANWAAAAYVAGTPLAVAWLAANAPRGLKLALGLHLAVALLLPIATRFPEAVAFGGRSPFDRMLGRADLAGEVAAMAQAEGAAIVIADNRGLIADLLHTLRDGPLVVHVPPPDGAPRNHFEMAVSLPPPPLPPALWVTQRPEPALPPGYTSRRLVRTWTPEQPFFRNRTLHAFLLSGDAP